MQKLSHLYLWYPNKIDIIPFCGGKWVSEKSTSNIRTANKGYFRIQSVCFKFHFKPSYTLCMFHIFVIQKWKMSIIFIKLTFRVANSYLRVHYYIAGFTYSHFLISNNPGELPTSLKIKRLSKTIPKL